jgi:hypothetical protein
MDLKSLQYILQYLQEKRLKNISILFYLLSKIAINH